MVQLEMPSNLPLPGRRCLMVFSGALEENAGFFLKHLKNSPKICSLQALWISEAVQSVRNFSLVTMTVPQAP